MYFTESASPASNAAATASPSCRPVSQAAPKRTAPTSSAVAPPSTYAVVALYVRSGIQKDPENGEHRRPSSPQTPDEAGGDEQEAEHDCEMEDVGERGAVDRQRLAVQHLEQCGEVAVDVVAAEHEPDDVAVGQRVRLGQVVRELVRGLRRREGCEPGASAGPCSTPCRTTSRTA